MKASIPQSLSEYIYLIASLCVCGHVHARACAHVCTRACISTWTWAKHRSSYTLPRFDLCPKEQARPDMQCPF